MKHLVDAVLADPEAALRNKSAAADELVSIGMPALPLIQEVLNGKWTSHAHAKDVLDAFSYIAERIQGRA